MLDLLDVVVKSVEINRTGEYAILCLEKPEGFTYIAGQYVVVFLSGEEKYMTLASAPKEEDLRIVMKLSNTNFKLSIALLKPGDLIKISKAAGNLHINTLHPEPQHRVFIAGGIGITPFRSILKELSESLVFPDCTLLYSAKTKSDAVYDEEFSQLASTQPHFSYVLNITGKGNNHATTRISGPLIRRYVKNYMNSHFYIAGSHEFISGVSSELLRVLGVLKQSITAEVFCGYCPEHICCCDHISVELGA